MSGMYGSTGKGYGMPPAPSRPTSSSENTTTPEASNNNTFTGSFDYSSPSIDSGSFQSEMLQDKNFYETYFYDSGSGDFGGEVGAKNLLPGMGELGSKLSSVWNSIGTSGFGAAFSAFDLEAAALSLGHINSLVDVFGGIESNVDQVMSYIQGFTNGGKGFDYDHAAIAKLMPVIDAYLAKADKSSSDYESVQKLKELFTSGKEEISTQDAKNMQIYLTTFKQIMVPHEVSTKSLSNLVVDAGRTYQDQLANQRNATETWGSNYLFV